MIPATSGLARAIAGTLEQCASRVRADGPAAWAFELKGDRPLATRARWEEPWLRLRAPLALSRNGEAAWRLLLLNGRLPGAARIVHPVENGHFELQADLPVFEPGLLPARLEQTCAALCRAVATVAGKAPDEPDGPPPTDHGAAAEPGWVGLAAERGWQLERREHGRYTVELDAPGVQSQASLEARGGELRLWIEILRGAALSAPARCAAARFLLTLTGLFRLVRGAAAGGEGEPHAIRLEASLPAEPSPTGAELELALVALSFACRSATREVRALADDLLARTYLDHLTLKE
jgi:hypothetical protein